MPSRRKPKDQKTAGESARPGEALRRRIETAIAGYDPAAASISLKGLGIQSPDAAWVVLRLTSLPGLTTLDIRGNSIGEVGAQAIAASLRGLMTLYISESSIGDAGAQAIAASLTGLTTLYIGANSIGDAGARAIAASLTGLMTLNISSNRIGDAGARAIADSLTDLTTLNIWNNSIGEAGARAIAASRTGLKTLNIGNNSIGDAGAQAIAASLTGLTTLSIWKTSIGDAGAQAIAAALTALTTLNISLNEIGDAGAQAIAASLRGLTTLNISSNWIGDAGAQAIAAALTALTTLDIRFNSIGDVETIIDLIRRLLPPAKGGQPGGALSEIRVDDNPLSWPREAVTVPPEVLNINEPERLLAELERLSPRGKSGSEAVPVVERIPWLRATLLGRQEIGKSHLWQRLLYATIKRKVEKTQAWECAVLRVEGMGPEGSDVPLRFFDLGGDPDLHGAHRTFLGDRRCIYIIVCDGSRPRQQSLLDYWLRIVRAYGGYPAAAAEGRGTPACAPAVLVVSWRDRDVDPSFGIQVLTESALAGQCEMDVRIVRDYWEPTGKGAATPPALNHDDRLEAVREAIRQTVRGMHGELNYGYPRGYGQVLESFEPVDAEGKARKTPMSRGPLTISQVQELFFQATGSEQDKQSFVGLDLLRNLGLVVCPDRDGQEAKQRREDPSAAGLLAPRDPPEIVQELRGLVFGVDWLRGPLYHIVRTGRFAEESGVVENDVLMEELTSQFSGPDASRLAKQVLQLLMLQRLVFKYDSDGELKYLIVDRLRATDRDRDRNILLLQERAFTGASRFVLRLPLLLDTHLPQFIGDCYTALQGSPILGSDARRDRVVINWRQNLAVQALLTVELNEAEIHAAIAGGSEVEQLHFLHHIEAMLQKVTGEGGGRFERVEKEMSPEDQQKAPASKKQPVVSKVEQPEATGSKPAKAKPAKDARPMKEAKAMGGGAVPPATIAPNPPKAAKTAQVAESGSTPEPRAIDGQIRQQLHWAMTGAFALPELERMVQFGMNVNLNSIVNTSASLSAIVFDLIQWAEAQGRLAELVTAARTANPGNAELREAAEAVGDLPAPAAASRGTGRDTHDPLPGQRNPARPYPGKIKLELAKRLTGDWRALADYFEIPPGDRKQFGRGRGPQGVWEWLEARSRLAELKDGLRAIGRNDLVDLLVEG